MAQRSKQLPRRRIPLDPRKKAKSKKKYRREATFLVLCAVLAPILAILVRSKVLLPDSPDLPSTATTVVPQTSIPTDDLIANSTKPIYRDADTDSPFHVAKLMLESYSLSRELNTMHTSSVMGNAGVVNDHIIDEGGYEGSVGTGEEEEQFLLEQWNSSDPKLRRLSRCKLLVSSMYKQNMNWTNAFALQYHNVSFDESWNRTMSKASTLMVERMRIYNYCFLDGISGDGLDTEEVFSAKFFRSRHLDEWDFQCRMFPFLKCDIDFENEMLWPSVYNLTFHGNVSNEQTFRFTSTPKPSLPSGTTLRSFNVNFMRNWARYSRGKGIVTTMSLLQIPLFKRHLRILDKLGNTLPIQVVTTASEYNDVFSSALLSAISQSKQQIYLVSLKGITNDNFLEQHDDPFLFKWLAALFNTFEEELLIDADTVLFEPATSYFNISGYRETGTYMYRDRALPVNHTAKCSDYMFRLEPSLEEARLTDIKLAHTRNDLSEYTPGVCSSEELVYYRFFRDNEHNHVDSGVVVLNKRRKFNGLLMGITLNLAPLLDPCSHGDKEFFWLGQLYAGELYAINAYSGGAAGELHDDYNDHLRIHRYTVCSTHIAHLNEQGKLSWVNGGLNRCKRGTCAQLDFEWMSEYFVPFATGVADVEKYYNQPAKMDGVLVPFSGSWKLGFECCGMENCAILFENDSREGFPGEGVLEKFSPSDIEYYNEIARIWSE